MLNINDAQAQLLLEYLPNARQHIESDDINWLLEDLDSRITEIGFDADWELNEIGLKLQKLYDALYDQN